MKRRMNGLVHTLAPGVVSEATGHVLEDEFEARLGESSLLAFRVAYGVLRHRQDAEDVAQETLVRAHRKLSSLRDRERFRAWLVRIAWRLAIDHRRSGRRREVREQASLDCAPEQSAEDLAAAGEFRERLWRAIDALPQALRIVVVLGGIEGHKMSELAALLSLPEGTVKSRLHIARTRLAEALR
jgi:RNA polymerase sigma-70 factor (ECF subfamily)